MYISNSVISKRRLDLESSDIETLWIEIKTKGMKFLVCIHVNEPTRNTVNSNTCLDQITNIPFLLSNISITPPIGNSDHSVVTAEFDMRIEKQHCYKRKVWYYNRCNCDDFKREINERDWDHCFSSDNAMKPAPNGRMILYLLQTNIFQSNCYNSTERRAMVQ